MEISQKSLLYQILQLNICKCIFVSECVPFFDHLHQNLLWNIENVGAIVVGVI